MAHAVVNLFGFHALQLGLPELDALAANRIPHRWLATQQPEPQAMLVTNFAALPFPANSLDLVVLPHTLEFSADPHTTLREVERVLVPEGRVVICGFNPVSLWSFSQRRSYLYRWFGLGPLPSAGDFIGYLRLRDWLRLLGFEVESGHFGCYRPALSSDLLLQRFGWMDKVGQRWWPFLGAAYFLVAIKRLHGMTLLNPCWKSPIILPIAPVSVVNNAGSTGVSAHNHINFEN